MISSPIGATAQNLNPGGASRHNGPPQARPIHRAEHQLHSGGIPLFSAHSQGNSRELYSVMQTEIRFGTYNKIPYSILGFRLQRGAHKKQCLEAKLTGRLTQNDKFEGAFVKYIWHAPSINNQPVELQLQTLLTGQLQDQAGIKDVNPTDLLTFGRSQSKQHILKEGEKIIPHLSNPQEFSITLSLYNDGFDHRGRSVTESAIFFIVLKLQKDRQPMEISWELDVTYRSASLLGPRIRSALERATMGYSGHPDQDIKNHEILSLPSPAPHLAATTYLVAAERALCHLQYNLPKIDKIFSVFQIPQSDYGLCTGFDQGVMQANLGFFEVIHVFIRSEVQDMPALLLELGSIFAPFRAILFTETSFYDIPVSEANSLAQASTISKSIDNGTDARTRPIAICLTRASGSDSPKYSGTDSNPQNNDNNNERVTDRGEEPDEDGPSSPHNKSDVGQGLETDPSGGKEKQDSWRACITWDVISEICSSQVGQPRVTSQCLGTKGKVVIERTSEGVELGQFATCKVQFTDLTFQNDRMGDNTKYGHFHSTVNINSLQRTADISNFEPKRSLKFGRVSKVTSASKTGLSGTASGTFTAGITPQSTFGMTFGGNAAHTKETTTGTEKSTNIHQITETNMYGAIEWGFHFTDPFEMEGGMLLDSFPRADFTFVGVDNTPAPPPQMMNIEVRTYWSLLPTKKSQRWPWFTLGKRPFYSNLCQISVLNVPSDLQGNHNYQATVHVFPQPSADELTVYNVNVQRHANPITVNIGVTHTEQGFNGNETGEWTGTSALSKDSEQLKTQSGKTGVVNSELGSPKTT